MTIGSKMRWSVRRYCWPLLIALAVLGSLGGCAGQSHSGKRGWFSKQPEPPRTVEEFLALPKPK